MKIKWNVLYSILNSDAEFSTGSKLSGHSQAHQWSSQRHRDLHSPNTAHANNLPYFYPDPPFSSGYSSFHCSERRERVYVSAYHDG